MHPLFWDAFCSLYCHERYVLGMKKFKLFSYNPPAKGVKKNDDRASVQTDFPGFFIMYGRKFWNLSNLNLLVAVYILLLSLGVWQLSAYPVLFYIFLGIFALLFGLVATGCAYTVRGYVRGDPVYILSDFKYAVKNNFKQGIILGIIDLVIIFLLVFDILFWSGMDLNYLTSYQPSDLPVQTEVSGSDTETDTGTGTVGDTGTGNVSDVKFDVSSTSNELQNDTADTQAEQQGDVGGAVDGQEQPQPETKERTFAHGVFFYVCLFLLIIYSFMRNYMYIIMVTFKLSIFKILKNSFIFAFLGIKRNLAALFGSIVVSIINIVIFVYIPLVGLTLPLIITTSTLMFIGAYAAYPVIKKYMITPYYKDEEVFDEYDKIFEDRE
ncbi:MAG: hypothetical protein DBX61_10280 [Clostridiales bacterium]|nr:MAG: hypothetical protein DBX61_10280 [Clostridiales bacterium]